MTSVIGNAMVRADWSHLAPLAVTVAEVVYSRLLELRPDLRGWLMGHGRLAHGRLAMTLVRWVNGVGDDEATREVALILISQHPFLTPGDYGQLGECLMYALSLGVGDARWAVSGEAWVDAYEELHAAISGEFKAMAESVPATL